MVRSAIKHKHLSVIRMTLKSYDNKLLDKVLDNCTKTINLSGGFYRGPVRLPTRRHLVVCLASPHVYKGTQNQFWLQIHKIVLDVYCGQNTLSALKELNISGGVEIKISVTKGLNNE